jgi:CubicO group peptidase (beta-lactamase class C family)
MTLRIPLAEGKISRFVELSPAPAPPGEEAAGKLTDEQVIERLAACMTRLVADHAFSGSVILARDGQPLLREAYGQASKSYAVPNRIDTRFNIASVGKAFTGVAVAKLVEQGKLSFEDPVSRHLPAEWLDPEVAATIQVRHLLTHTSGLGDYFRKLYATPTPRFFRGLDDYRPLVADAKPAFEPGARSSYSNLGMLLAGVVIEQVTKGSYFDYVREHIYEPAGMTGTDAYDKDSVLPNRATGYSKEVTEEGARWWNNWPTRVLKGSPSGGSYSTAEDLLRFDVALRAHRLLDSEHTHAVLTPKPEIGAPGNGYGFFVSAGPGGRVASASGDGRGISCHFRMYLDSGYTFVVLSNYDRPAADIVDSVVRQMIARP